MAYRCINAFSTATRVVAHGAAVEDDDPILDTHGIHFAHVHVPAGPTVVESASTDTPRTRSTPKKKPAPKPDGDPKDDGGDPAAPVG